MPGVAPGTALYGNCPGPVSRPGAWRDADMLLVGVGNLSETEWKTHLSLWALLAAPLWVGADITRLDPAAMAVLLNAEVLAIDQDALAIMAKRVPLSNASGAGREVRVAASSCNTTSFSHTFEGIQCEGFSPMENASTLAACAAACCAMNKAQPGRCKTWLLWNGGGWWGGTPCIGPPSPGSVGASMLNGSHPGTPPPPAPPPPAPAEVWARPLQARASHNERVAAAVGLFNPNVDGDRSIRFDFADLCAVLQGMHQTSFDTTRSVPHTHAHAHTYTTPHRHHRPVPCTHHHSTIRVRDVWEHVELGEFAGNGSFVAKNVPPHGE